VPPEDINKAIQHRIAVTAPNLEWLYEACSSMDGRYDKEVWIHIKVNSGMNRLGTSDIGEISRMIEFTLIWIHTSLSYLPSMLLHASYSHSKLGAVTAMRCWIALLMSSGGTAPSTSTFSRIPCMRSSIASSNVATAKKPTPRAAR